jgi:hypothetical protein
MLDPEVIKAEQVWAQQVVTNAKSILIQNRKVASGRLVNSVRYTVNSQGKISFLYDIDGKWVTQGRRRGSRFPPPAPILKWIKEKGIRGRDSKTGRFITDKSLTFLISRAIARDGIAPLPFMKMAIEKSIKQLGKSLKTSLAKVEAKRWRDAIRKTFKP